MKRMPVSAIRLMLAGLLAAQPFASDAASCTASSGAATAALVELYTSEGCSSCPPADRWLSTLAPGPVVPLALHVDYWDYIGWADRYAQPGFSRRQRDTVRRSGGRVAYTPQVVLDGRDFPHWSDDPAFARALREIAARPPQARLELTASEAGGGWAVELAGQVQPRRGRAETYLALYESGLESDVRAGENKGVRLRHDYVVREWIGPLPVGGDGKIALARDFPRRADVDFGRAGIAAFVQDPDSGQVLQAVALRLCKR